MAVFKCKHCGEALDLATAVDGVCKCAVCNMYQTVSLKVESSPNLEAFYGNASHFRRRNEFDLAISVYQQILAIDDSDAEAYFNVALCRYGIEYVKDPRTEATLPTVNRTQLQAFSDDDDFQMALSYATDAQKEIFTKQAQIIDEILRGYWQISNNEEPFDVFICYKESDNQGGRTEDSAIAQSLYRELTRDSLKVFYARETLKGKLGSEYEPYIFAALNSARFMLVIGTKKEYFNAVWVKNEWSRYLALIAQGKKKTLIPVYRDIDAYSLPKEFKNLQAQNYAEVGATDNIVLAIENVIKQERPETVVVKETTTVVTPTYQAPVSNEDALIKRAYELLNEGNFSRVNDCVERILNMNFECGEAYFIKFLSEGGYRGIGDFEKRGKNYKNTPGYQQVIKYAEGDFKTRLIEIEKTISYNEGVSFLAENKYDSAQAIFNSLGDFKDSKNKIIECENARMQLTYDAAVVLMDNKAYDQAILIFNGIVDFKDSKKQIARCEIAKTQIVYDEAVSLMNSKHFDEAISVFNVIVDFKDSKSKINECENGKKQVVYDKAVSLMNNNQFDSAVATFNRIIDFKDAKDKINECENSKKQIVYNEAASLMNVKQFDEAISIFNKIIDFKDAKDKINECENGKKQVIYDEAIFLIEIKQFDEAISAFSKILEFKDAQEKIDECKQFIYDSAISLMANQRYSEAIPIFNKLADFKDSKKKITECNVGTNQVCYDKAIHFMQKKQYAKAISTFHKIIDFMDAKEQISHCKRLYKKKNVVLTAVLALFFLVGYISLFFYITTDSFIFSARDTDDGIVIGDMNLISNVTINKNIVDGTLTIPSEIDGKKVVGIGDGAFENCTAFTSVTIPDSVTWIGNYAFSNCTSLTSITIPNSVTSIGYRAFCGCTPLTIYCETESEPSGWCSDWNDSKCPVVWNCKNNEVAADGCIYAVIDGIRYRLKNNIATVVRQSRVIEEAIIPSSVTYKGNTYSVTSIGSSAFYNCTSLTSVTIGGGVTSIGSSAFYDCDSLTSVTIGGGVTSIGNSAFEYCTSLASVTIPNSVTSIGNYAFDGCTSLTSVTIPSSVTSIGSHAFYNCTSLTSITIPSSVTSIGYHALSIGKNAFSGCTSLTIYCEAESKPSGWDSNWHSSVGTVVWGAEMPE